MRNALMPAAALALPAGEAAGGRNATVRRSASIANRPNAGANYRQSDGDKARADLGGALRVL
jgi:hypothetical protein